MNLTSRTSARVGLVALLALVLYGVLSVAPATAPAPRALSGHANPLSLSSGEEIEPSIGHFVEVMGGCDAAYVGTCVVAHSAPSEDAPVMLRLRAGMVLKVASTSVTDVNGHVWHEIVFDEWIRYPKRLGDSMFVEASTVRAFVAPSIEEWSEETTASTTKRIVVSRSEQKVYAYDGEELVFWWPTSTGLSLTPTPRGDFKVYRKTPSRYMQGPLPGISDQYYDLPGVPWDLYFTKEGGTIHGAYWHDSFGTVWSHGCVNLPQDAARTLYHWAPLGTPVIVRD